MCTLQHEAKLHGNAVSPGSEFPAFDLLSRVSNSQQFQHLLQSTDPIRSCKSAISPYGDNCSEGAWIMALGWDKKALIGRISGVLLHGNDQNDDTTPTLFSRLCDRRQSER